MAYLGTDPEGAWERVRRRCEERDFDYERIRDAAAPFLEDVRRSEAGVAQAFGEALVIPGLSLDEVIADAVGRLETTSEI